MTPVEFVSQVLDPGIAWCKAVPGWNVPFDERARVMLTAISGQEANWTERIQGGRTPAAHSFWQQERMGSVHGVLHHPATAALARMACAKATIPADEIHVWGFFATAAGDNLALAFARMNLWIDPHSLPSVGDEQDAWLTYVRVWRPGAVTEGGQRARDARDRWSENYPQAMDAMKGQTENA